MLRHAGGVQGQAVDTERIKAECRMFKELAKIDARRAGFYQDQLSPLQELMSGAGECA